MISNRQTPDFSKYTSFAVNKIRNEMKIPTLNRITKDYADKEQYLYNWTGQNFELAFWSVIFFLLGVIIGYLLS